MNNRDWERFGEDIYRSVQEAVNTGDFSSLNQTVTGAVDDAFQSLGRGVRGMNDAMNRTMENYARNKQNRQEKGEQTYEYYEPNEQKYEQKTGYSYHSEQSCTAARNAVSLYEKTTGTKVLGIVFSVLEGPKGTGCAYSSSGVAAEAMYSIVSIAKMNA